MLQQIVAFILLHYQNRYILLTCQQLKMQNQSQKHLLIKKNVKEHVEAFKNLNDQQIKVQRMTGITNQTYKVSYKEKSHNAVIYREFGQSQTNIFLDRGTQKIIYSHVSESKQGPKIYCYIGQHIRIQQFIQSNVLDGKDMLKNEVIEHVAYTLRQFHSMKDPNISSKKSIWQNIFFDQSQKFINICQDKLNKQIYDQHQKPLIQLLKKWVCQEQIQFLKIALKQLEDQPLVFGHNDLLNNNILIQKSDGKFVFIDYEYSSFNHSIYDIANYFAQAQFDYDCNQLPYFKRNINPQNIDELRHKFIQCYCLAEDVSYPYFLNRLKSNQQKQKVKEKVSKLKSQFYLAVMLSHIYWGWWGIIVCKNPNIKFDYLQFCKIRIQNYNTIKYGGFWKLNL